MRGRGLASALLALLWLAPAAAEAPVVVSPGPEAIAVTVYRQPSSEPIDLDWLQGFALVSETRSFTLPAGESVIRFEGVAGGIIPASAIVRGLPRGVGEKNLDARLLSPGTLIDASLGRRVHIRRTNDGTGKVTEAEAVIRSGPNGIVLQTAAGFEALRCTGVPETLLFDGVPEGLTDKPTLAVRTRSDRAQRVTATLSYLATDFDWRANYVAQMAPDGRSLDLFAWLTLANANDESFPDARVAAVAGRLNRDEEVGDNSNASIVPSELSLHCWPQGRTHEIPDILPPTPSLDVVESLPALSSEQIVVTGSRIHRENLAAAAPITVISAEQEELGDLKLYRIPIPVTVAAHAQKQIALLNRSHVPVERLYSFHFEAGRAFEAPMPASVLLRTDNVKAKNLGLPLPAGAMAVFEPVGGEPVLAGETTIDDHAVGERLEIEVGEAAGIRLLARQVDPKPEQERSYEWWEGRKRRFELEVTNDRPFPATVEIVLQVFDRDTLTHPSRKLGLKDGRRMWRAEVPANGRLTLGYTIETAARPKPKDDD
ncbi:MAG: hypothetical protein QOJ94_723 [Sphingomonadales bacterium]|nr:hypothetical protein [Sphingomonadales bacterium]